MRQKRNRLDVRRLFILGAGASHSATQRTQRAIAKQTPLDRDFSQRVLELALKRPKWIRKARKAVEKGWRDHRPMESFGLEEAVIRQLAHLEFVDAIHPHRRASISQFEWLNNLTHLMCYALRRGRENDDDVYKKFAGFVYPLGTDHENYRDRIVTFNYDDLLDARLLERLPLGSVYFDNLLPSRSASNRGRDNFKNPLLVKLHGSINWRCEKDEFEKLVVDTDQSSSYRIDKIWYQERRMPAPDRKIYPLIMPPLPKKPITRISIFQYLWTRAYEYLHEAEEIIIAGYSLPEADQLALSLFGNFSNDKLQEVTVVDPEPAIIRRWQELFRRRNVGVARWTYYDDFSDYVERNA